MLEKAQTIQELIANRALKSQNEIDNFQKALEKLKGIILGLDDSRQLLMIFHDEYETPEPMYNLFRYAINNIDREILIEALISIKREEINGWLNDLYGILLADFDNCPYFRSIFVTLSQGARENVLTIFNEFLETKHEDFELVERLDIPIKATIECITKE